MQTSVFQVYFIHTHTTHTHTHHTHTHTHSLTHTHTTHTHNKILLGIMFVYKGESQRNAYEATDSLNILNVIQVISITKTLQGSNQNCNEFTRKFKLCAYSKFIPAICHECMKQNARMMIFSRKYDIARLLQAKNICFVSSYKNNLRAPNAQYKFKDI